jgi:hypothetical protein
VVGGAPPAWSGGGLTSWPELIPPSAAEDPTPGEVSWFAAATGVDASAADAATGCCSASGMVAAGTLTTGGSTRLDVARPGVAGADEPDALAAGVGDIGDAVGGLAGLAASMIAGRAGGSGGESCATIGGPPISRGVDRTDECQAVPMPPANRTARQTRAPGWRTGRRRSRAVCIAAGGGATIWPEDLPGAAGMTPDEVARASAHAAASTLSGRKSRYVPATTSDFIKIGSSRPGMPSP